MVAVAGASSAGRFCSARPRSSPPAPSAIAADMTREMGKPLREARVEAARGADTLRFCAGEAWRSQGEIFSHSATGNPIQVLRRPLGVVGLICPWNFPFSIPLWKAAPALVHGNCVVLKVAHEAPGAGLHLAACLDEAGVPNRGVQRRGRAGQDVGSAADRHIRAYARSRSPGRAPSASAIRDDATALGKRVQLELGGHSPLVVLRRRRPSPRRRGGVRGSVLVGRAEVHGDTPDLRPRRRLRQLQDAVRRPDRAGRRRRPCRPRHRGRTADLRAPDERRAGGGRARRSRRRQSGCLAANVSTTTPTWCRPRCSRASTTRRFSRRRRSSAPSPRCTVSLT